MILAGGLSTRLYPLTKLVPKPLVPVAGVPNAAHLLHYLRAYGFDEIAINLHYLADAIVRSLGDGSRFGVKLHYSYEPELLGSAGGVKNVESFFGGEPFVVIGCDEVTDLRLDRLVKFHRDREAIATIGLVECEQVDQYGVVVVDDRGKIVGFQEKPAPGTELSKLVNTGVYAFSPAIFEHIPAAEFYDFGKQVFPSLQAAGERFYGFDARGAYWADIGTPAEYRRASYDVVRGVVRIPQTPGDGIDPSAEIASGVQIDGPVHVGAAVRVAEGVTIVGPSVLGDRVHVQPGARLERAICWEGATIGKSAMLRDTIVGNDYAVAAGSVLVDALVASSELCPSS
ncbi:MAG TPA: NDP-sugar synthase [Candidatus Babeliales bacterium]|nr:NDP-sugar synthase [Candidatus Babeliales bacterium]